MSAEALVGWGLAATAGAIIGSFLTVVAARVPKLVLATADGRVAFGALLRSLSWPGSHCGHCQSPLRWRDNVPIISFVVLRGHCRSCRHPYGHQYLLLECSAAVMAAACAFAFGWSAQAALLFVFLAALLALSAIDLAEMLLPDLLVYPLLPLGLLYQKLYGAGWSAGFFGAASGWALLWLVAAVYRHSRGRDGMGGGDIKLAGAIGAWLGLEAVPPFFLLAFVTGLVGMGVPVLLGRSKADAPVPFGPFLALSGATFALIPQAASWVSRFLAG